MNCMAMCVLWSIQVSMGLSWAAKRAMYYVKQERFPYSKYILKQRVIEWLHFYQNKKDN